MTAIGGRTWDSIVFLSRVAPSIREESLNCTKTIVWERLSTFQLECRIIEWNFRDLEICRLFLAIDSTPGPSNKTFSETDSLSSSLMAKDFAILPLATHLNGFQHFTIEKLQIIQFDYTYWMNQGRDTNRCYRNRWFCRWDRRDSCIWLCSTSPGP